MAIAPARPVDPELGTRILKVNHAGEHGAVHIYAAQAWVARWTAPALVPELRAFEADEARHRAVFEAELRARGRPRCRSYRLCALGGLVLGALTALGGRAAMAATTVAVERVVLGHLHAQIEALRDVDPAATATVRAVIDDEQQHHDRSAAHLPAQQRWLRLLQPIVAGSTEAVIWLGMRL